MGYTNWWEGIKLKKKKFLCNLHTFHLLAHRYKPCYLLDSSKTVYASKNIKVMKNKERMIECQSL